MKVTMQSVVAQSLRDDREAYYKLVQASVHNIGPWLASALEDPTVKDSFKEDILIFFKTLDPCFMDKDGKTFLKEQFQQARITKEEAFPQS